MYDKNRLIGILVALGRCESIIERKDSANMGYRVRLRLSLRGEEVFLRAIKRSLEQHQIQSNLYERESSSREKPILRITGNLNLFRTMNFIPEYLPDCKGDFSDFRKIVNIVADKKHLTLEGFDEILKLKGEI